MLSMPTLRRLKLTENTIFVTGLGRRRAEAFHALGHQVVSAGRREKVLRNWSRLTLNFFVTAACWHRLTWPPNFANSEPTRLCCENSRWFLIKHLLSCHNSHGRLS
jgi:hypothetical protein